MKKFDIIFDGNFIYHRAFSIWSTYYRGENLSDVLAEKEGRQRLIRKAIIDFCAIINKFEGAFDVNRVIFVFDERSWRYKLYPNYKYALTKVKGDHYEGFLDVLGRLQRLLESRGFIVTHVDGAEGDDMLATWAYVNNCQEGEGVDHTLLITADSDIRQLVSERLSVYCPIAKNETLYKHYQAPLAIEALPEGVSVVDVNPVEVIIGKILLGDKSDNIPQLKKGFGPAAFTKLVGNYLNSGVSYEWPLAPIIIAGRIIQNFGLKEHEELIKSNATLTYLSPLSMPEEVCERALDEVINKYDSYGYSGSFTLDGVYYGDNE